MAAHLHGMRSLARLLLLLAAFAYGAMPMTGMSAMAMPVAHMVDAVAGAHEAGSAADMVADVDCPHSGASTINADGGEDTGKPLKMTWHCAACLTLPADPVLAESGKPARAAEAATRFPRLVSQLTAPLTPPPRA